MLSSMNFFKDAKQAVGIDINGIEAFYCLSSPRTHLPAQFFLLHQREEPVLPLFFVLSPETINMILNDIPG